MGPKPEDLGDGNRPNEEFHFGKGGQGGPFMTMDEAEESRFFTVDRRMKTAGSSNKYRQNFCCKDEEGAEEYAAEALASGDENGIRQRIQIFGHR